MGLVAAFLLWWVARCLRIRRLPSVVLALFGACGVLWAGRLVTPLPEIPSDVRVQIVSPQTGITVPSQQIEVAGIVEPRGSKVLVAVRSETADMWSVLSVGPVLSGDRWRIMVSLGTSTEGLNENFSIVALARNENEGIEERREWTVVALPDLPRSDAVIVHREPAPAP